MENSQPTSSVCVGAAFSSVTCTSVWKQGDKAGAQVPQQPTGLHA